MTSCTTSSPPWVVPTERPRRSRAGSRTATTACASAGGLRAAPARQGHRPARDQPRGRAPREARQPRSSVSVPRWRPRSTGEWSRGSCPAEPVCARSHGGPRRSRPRCGAFTTAGRCCRRASRCRSSCSDTAARSTDRGAAAAGELDRAQELAARIAAALAAVEPRPCHDDLLPGNLIREQASGRVMLVDWEYAGHGPPAVRPRQPLGQQRLRRRGRGAPAERVPRTRARRRSARPRWR